MIFFSSDEKSLDTLCGKRISYDVTREIFPHVIKKIYDSFERLMKITTFHLRHFYRQSVFQLFSTKSLFQYNCDKFYERSVCFKCRK